MFSFYHHQTCSALTFAGQETERGNNDLANACLAENLLPLVQDGQTERHVESRGRQLDSGQDFICCLHRVATRQEAVSKVPLVVIGMYCTTQLSYRQMRFLYIGA